MSAAIKFIVAVFLIFFTTSGIVVSSDDINVLEARLGSSDYKKRLEAVEKLSEKEKDALPVLKNILQGNSTDLKKTSALLCLKKMREKGKPLAGEVVSLLADKNKDIRFAATDALVWIKPKPEIALRPLCGRLKDEDPRVRYVAATALGRLGGEAAEAAPFLLESLEEGNAQAAWALSQLGLKGDPVYNGLSAALENSSHLVRAQAVKALGKLFPQRAQDLIIARLDDSSSYVSEIAERTLRKIDPEFSEKIKEIRAKKAKSESSEGSGTKQSLFIKNPLPELKR